ncbi:hypothetical protein HYU10_02300 [Candidatus Woesearchaeota archaeon]|nr:hypothetical protein [Candidatus Woesearchaeota archaeon]MBI2661252.1 hypothetical protein [Candidatus Woesearchaeota archaeon]
MDIFAHGLWGYAVFHRNRRNAWLAALFSVLPDIIPFAPVFIMRLLSGNFDRGPPPISSIPKYTTMAYGFTHSIIIFSIVFLLVFLLTRKWYWPMAGWGIHILSDIPTHSSRFFATPFLFPVSDYRYNGISWGTPWFMALNWTALLIVLILIARYRAKARKDKSRS